MTIQHRCTKCGKTMADTNFYKDRDGKPLDICKKCLTLHVNPFEPETFEWILKKVDVPYIERKWDEIRDKEYAKNPRKLGAVVGKYLSQMKLNQFKKFTYLDSDELNEQDRADKEAYLKEHPEAALKEQQIKEQYERGLIGEAQYKTMTSSEFRRGDDMERMVAESIMEAGGPMPQSLMEKNEYIGPGAELDTEDKLYLAMKWGTMYQPNEWLALETNYNEMTESFDIRDADSISALKMLCKANLKANQAIDMNDFDGFQKLTKVTDSLRKSSKWTALQNKDEATGGLQAVGLLVSYCEKEGGKIPRFPLDLPQDDYDVIINDSKNYYKELFFSDPSLKSQVETYLQKKEMLDEKKRQKELALAAGVNPEDLDVVITDEDIADYKAAQEELKEHDKQVYQEEESDTNEA